MCPHQYLARLRAQRLFEREGAATFLKAFSKVLVLLRSNIRTIAGGTKGSIPIGRSNVNVSTHDTERKEAPPKCVFMKTCPEENTSEDYYKEVGSSSSFIRPLRTEAMAVLSSLLALLCRLPCPVSALQLVPRNMLIPICFQH